MRSIFSTSVTWIFIILGASVMLSTYLMAGSLGNSGDGNIITSVPRDMTYQGILKDSAGDPVTDTTVNATFRIYDDEFAGTMEWSQGMAITTDDAGVFDVTLDNLNIPFDEDYWLEIQIDTEPGPMTPRQKVTLSGYAARTDTSDYALNAGTDSDWMISGSDMYSGVSGNVGIGIDSPVYKLHVIGNFRANTVNTGQGDNQLYDMNQNVTTSSSPTFATVNTGQGNNELYAMNQHVQTSDNPSFNNLSLNRAYISDYGYALGGFHVGGTADPGTDNLIVDGNLGVGTTPSDMLDVNGDIRVRGADIKDAGGTTRISLYDDGSLHLKEDGGSTSLTVDTNGEVGIGTTSPSYPLHVSTSASRAGNFTSSYPSTSNHTVHAEVTATGNYDARAVYGKSTPADYYGFGGYFEGGYMGVRGIVSATGSNFYYGVRGSSTGTGAGTNYGVYGYGYSSAGTSYGVYYSGGLAGTGTKSCIVKTSQGPTLLYCQESPENWFEDFGEGQLQNGRAHIDLDALFLETVTINDTHPMKVFVQLEGDCNGVYVSKGSTGFDVIELNKGTSNAPFSYRVVAKRQGFEDRRLDYTAAGENDPYLYPEKAAEFDKKETQ
ncbi:MAG: hypothetical protein JSW64_02630 [Candidatus Zixiibacteriota bacterium]|nr:MAG: hypothetical protein JSW64_02630 [candidate division Zixibacteria bacterium]